MLLNVDPGQTGEVADGFLIDDVDDVIDGDDPQQYIVFVDYRYSQKVIVPDFMSYIFLPFVYVHGNDPLAHDIANHHIFIVHDQIPQGNDADQYIIHIDDVNIVDGFRIRRFTLEDGHR